MTRTLSFLQCVHAPGLQNATVSAKPRKRHGEFRPEFRMCISDAERDERRSQQNEDDMQSRVQKWRQDSTGDGKESRGSATSRDIAYADQRTSAILKNR